MAEVTPPRKGYVIGGMDGGGGIDVGIVLLKSRILWLGRAPVDRSVGFGIDRSISNFASLFAS